MVSVRLFVALSTVALVAAEPLADLYAPSTATGVRGVRIRRQLPPLEEGNQVIDSIFQVRLATRKHFCLFCFSK
jgi:hypothetical protein